MSAPRDLQSQKIIDKIIPENFDSQLNNKAAKDLIRKKN